MKIRLETGSGQLVVERHIPPFRALPEVVIWGSRHFSLCLETESKDLPVYREIFAYAVLDVELDWGSVKDIPGKPALGTEDEKVKDVLSGRRTLSSYIAEQRNNKGDAKLSDAVYLLPHHPSCVGQINSED